MVEHVSGLGPVDYLVVEFPSGVTTFTESMFKSLLTLVDKEIIRVLDLLVFKRRPTGELEVFEIEDFDFAELRILDATMAEILAADDIENLACAVAPGAAAGVIVWENVGVAPMAAAASDVGAQIVAQGRIPSRAVLDTIEADRKEGR
ncbi:DUF6325 family protein [Williamsia muralis]|uniref:DUF6325 family protein n=1 Tax=Williamsia marianensis TaxID=85044 RepID=A0ABU4EXB4_WILMA|nr:DUF6325 family protein [Williamsia muralis]MDV7135299.1 DUF6325 family protein [Williamsia muralis]